MNNIIGCSILTFTRRNPKKIFFYLCCIILFTSILVFWAIYHNSGNYKIRNVVQRPSTKSFGKDFGKEIQTTRIFVEKYINSYQDVIEKEINPDFKSSFALAKGRKLSTLVIFSTVSEAFLGIYPSTQNDLIVECTKYPVQMALFSGLDQNDSGVRLVVPYEEALKEYNEYKGLSQIPSMIGYGTLSSNFPKLFSFSKDSFVVLVDMAIEIRGSDANRVTNIKPVGFITGEKDFYFAIEMAEKSGRNLAEFQISHLFRTSEFFRKALLDEHLSAIAKEINQNCSRAEKDPEYKYQHWEFKKDVNELKEEAEANGIDASYIDDLLRYPANQPKDGHLLWYYPNHFWFSVQWTIINTCLLLVFITLIILKNKNNKIAVLINKLWPKLFILLSINAWVFTEKPKYMSVKYWIIPGTLLVACFLLTVLKTERRRIEKQVNK